MEKMTLENMIECCVVGTDPIIELTKLDTRLDIGKRKTRVIDTTYYNCDNVPKKYFDFPVSYIEQAKQFDGTTALIFTVYEYEGENENDTN